MKRIRKMAVDMLEVPLEHVTMVPLCRRLIDKKLLTQGRHSSRHSL